MATIQLKTPIPGPKSKALAARRADAIPRGLSIGTPVYVAKAEDAWLEDVDGNRYLDFAGGIGCLNVGHRRDPVVKAIKTQADRFLHTCIQVTPYEEYVRLAERMNQVTPGKFPKKTLFVNSGAEAVENAVKIARAHTGRSGIIAFEDAFHGRTMMTLALTSKTHPYKAGFAPFPGDVYRIPYAYCYRCPLNLTYPDCGIACAEKTRGVIRNQSAQRIAAVIVEPMQGTAGNVIPPPGFLPAVQAIARENGALFIADEMITGFGRTGKFWGVDHDGVVPDVMTCGKGIGGGFPLAAVVSTDGLTAAKPWSNPSGSSSSYGGNPLASAAGLAALEIITRENLVENSRRVGAAMLSRLQAMQEKHRIIGDVRGKGLLLGLELVKDRRTKELVSKDTTKALFQECLRRGLVAMSYTPVIRLNPPLNIDEATALEGLDILDEALGAVARDWKLA